MIKTFILIGALVAVGSAQLRNSYGLPVVQQSNQFDSPQVIIPSTSYGTPIAPSPTYGVPSGYPVPIVKIPIRNTYSFTIPKQEPAPVPAYGLPLNDVPAPLAPVPVYGIPSTLAPAPPAPIYGFPPVNDVPAEPAEVYGIPTSPTTTTPAPTKPAIVYGPPPTPAIVYGPPPTPTKTTTATPKPLRVPAVVYGPPADEYVAPAVPAQVYGSPSDTYGPPALVPAQVYGVPTEQVCQSIKTVYSYVISSLSIASKIENAYGVSASYLGTTSTPVGLYCPPSRTNGEVLLSHSVIPIPSIVQPESSPFLLSALHL